MQDYAQPFLSTWAASISASCGWMPKESGSSMHIKNKSDFSKNDLWLCLKIQDTQVL